MGYKKGKPGYHRKDPGRHLEVARRNYDRLPPGDHWRPETVAFAWDCSVDYARKCLNAMVDVKLLEKKRDFFGLIFWIRAGREVKG